MRSASTWKTLLPLGAALLLALSGCARSAIELQPEESPAQADADDGTEDEPAIEDAAETPEQEDASDEQPIAHDASDAPSDASGESEGGGPNDSGAALDALATEDAGTDGAPDASASSEAGADTSTPPPEAGAGSSCSVASCTNDCAISGPFRCCTERDTCGCSWAPGAYCL